MPENIKRGFSIIGGISATVEIKTETKAGWRTVDLEPVPETFRTLSITGNSSRYGWGQIDETLRAAIESGEIQLEEPRRSTVLRFLDIWERWHMNDAQAGTRAQQAAIEQHEREHIDCRDSHRGDLYGHRCEVLKNMPPFSVTCLDDPPEGWEFDAILNKAKRLPRVLATSQTFPTREAAQEYARTVAPSRDPQIVGIYLDRGYKYGHAWLVDPLPAEIEAELLEIMDDKPARQQPAADRPEQITKEEKETREILAKLPAPPDGSPFRPVQVRTITLPHPYMVTGKSFRTDSPYLDTEAPCGECGKPASQHEQQKTLFIAIRGNNHDLNAVPGLHAYLLAIKEQAESLGIQGFAFPKEKAA